MAAAMDCRPCASAGEKSGWPCPRHSSSQPHRPQRSAKAMDKTSTTPKRDKSAPALRAALGAIQRHGFDVVLAGVTGYAATVAAWTPAERVRFVKNAPEFFDLDLWNQPAANWNGRNGHTAKPMRTIDVGGRKPDLSLMKELYPRTNTIP